MPLAPTFASPVDTERYGEYRIPSHPGDERPTYRFDGRLGTPELPAVGGRYHLYAGWFCPWAHRVTIVHAHVGLADTISVSYVDDRRDARGWAFREHRGADPVNGFELLRDAYDITEPVYDGHVSVPTLWDRETTRVVSNRFDHLDLDLATQFGATDLAPPRLRGAIDAIDRLIGPAVNQGVGRARGTGPEAVRARIKLDNVLDELDDRLAERRFLLGPLTLADVRLFVTLVRFGEITSYPNLWAYARDLFARPAFATTTDFTSFTAAGTAELDWTAPSGRDTLPEHVA